MENYRTGSTSLRMDFIQLETAQQSGKWLSTEPKARIPDEKQSFIIHTAQNEAPEDKVAMDANLGYDGGEAVSQVVSQLNEDGMRPLVLYTYAESDNARANLEYFIAKGIHGAADFIFVFNGETNATELLPYEPNIKIIQRENKCYDLGAIGEVLLKDDLWKKYKRFITLNASIRGPFLPTYASSSCWTDMFLDRVTEKVKVRNSSPWKALTETYTACGYLLQLRSKASSTVNAVCHRRCWHGNPP